MTVEVKRDDPRGIPYIAITLNPHKNEEDDMLIKYIQSGARISLYETDGMRTFMVKDEPSGNPTGEFVTYIVFK